MLPGSPLLSPLTTTPTGSTPALAFEQRGCVLQLPLSLAESLKNHEKQSAQYFGQRCSSVDQSCPIDWAQVLWSGPKQPKRLGQGVKRFGAHLVPIGTLLVPIGDRWIDISVIKCFSPYNLERRKKKEKTIKEKKNKIKKIKYI